MTWPQTWPATLHPLVEARHDEREDVDPADAVTVLVPDEAVTVEAFQVRPDLLDAAQRWSGGVLVEVNGGPALLVARGVAGLGDYLVRRAGSAVTHAEPAAGFAQRYQPAEPTP